MRKLLFLFVIFSSISVYGQRQSLTDEKLLEYIYKEWNCVSLVDTAYLPKEVKACQHLIEAYLVKKKEKPPNYFVDISYIEFTNNTISVPLFYIDGFRKHKQGIHQDGNASGKDMGIVIDLSEMKVVKVLKYQ